MSEQWVSLHVAIPEIEFVSTDTVFAGYKKLPGDFLTKELYGAFSLKEKASILNDIARFLTELHSMPLEAFPGNEVDVIDFEKEYREDFERLKKYLYPTFSTRKQERLERQFNSYLTNKDNFTYKPVLPHHDFSPDHILIDGNKARLKGIIDFGDAAIGDPDYDLLYLYGDMGEGFVTDLLRFYKHSNHDLLFGKLKFFSLVNDLDIPY